jgi:hypothetical protein
MLCVLQAKQLAAEVADLFRNVLRLHLKMNRNKTSRRSSGGRTGLSPTSTADQLSSEAEDESLEALELTESSPQQLSFWIAHVFSVSLAGRAELACPSCGHQQQMHGRRAGLNLFW